MTKHHCVSRLAGLAASLLLVASAQAALPPGVSGAWYNPSQSGHGLSIKIIAPDRALVFWYAYDLEGNSFNLYIDGRIQGSRIDAVAVAPRGMRFGSFDPSELEMPAWGHLIIDIEDCIYGRLSWDAIDPAFGSGSIEIVRLVGIDTQACQRVQPGLIAGGLYDANATTAVPGTAPPQYRTRPGIAAVDPDGRLWGMEFIRDGAGGALPGPTSVVTPPQVIQTHFNQPHDGNTGIIVRPTFNSWARQPTLASGPVQGEWQSIGTGLLRYGTASWGFRPTTAALVTPLSAERLEGRYSLLLDGEPATTPAALDVSVDGALCLRYLTAPDPEGCQLAGRYWLVDHLSGFFEFELKGSDAARAPGRAYRGRGWLQSDAEGEAIVLIGDDGYSGFGLIAR